MSNYFVVPCILLAIEYKCLKIVGRVFQLTHGEVNSAMYLPKLKVPGAKHTMSWKDFLVFTVSVFS